MVRAAKIISRRAFFKQNICADITPCPEGIQTSPHAAAKRGMFSAENINYSSLYSNIKLYKKIYAGKSNNVNA